MTAAALAACDRLSRALMILSAVAAFGLGFYMTADVVLRTVDQPIRGTAEYVRETFVAIVFLQLPYCVSSRSMISVELARDAAPAPVRAALGALAALAGAAFFAVIAWGSAGPALDAILSGEFEGEGAVRVPVWPSRVAILAGCALSALIFLLQALDRAPAPAGGRG